MDAPRERLTPFLIGSPVTPALRRLRRMFRRYSFATSASNRAVITACPAEAQAEAGLSTGARSAEVMTGFSFAGILSACPTRPCQSLSLSLSRNPIRITVPDARRLRRFPGLAT